MSDTIFKYPLDLTGKSPTNKVENEEHTIGSRLGRIFIADYGPFFGNDVTLVDAVTGKELVPVDDYKLVHYYEEASDRTGQAVYTGAQIVNASVSTSILFDAQYVGGEFSYSAYAIRQAIEALQNDNRPVTWGALVGVPSQFVPAPHLHDAYDLYGLKYLVDATLDVATALREGDSASRTLLLQQVDARFKAFDSFCMALAEQFESGAAELRAIV